MKKCELCKSKMPDELFVPAFMNGEYVTGLCPICTMTLINKEMGLPGMHIPQGEMASELVDEAWQYYAPVGKDIYNFQKERKKWTTK